MTGLRQWLTVGMMAGVLMHPPLSSPAFQRVDATPTPLAATPLTLPPAALIDSPTGGEALQGVVSIQGSLPAGGFLSAEISFAYADDPTGTWFWLASVDHPITHAPLAHWDTTTITDGTYRLRMQVFLQGGEVRESILEGVRVRNYSPVETSTPAPTQAAIPLSPGTSLPPTLTPTPTPLPSFVPRTALHTPASAANPVTVTAQDWQSALTFGALAGLAVLALIAAYMGVKSLWKK